MTTTAHGTLVASPRQATDGVTTDGDATITSATMAFTAADVGRYISGTGIPPGTKIASYTSATEVELDALATADGTGITFQLNQVIEVVVTAWHGVRIQNRDGTDDVDYSISGGTPDEPIYGYDGVYRLGPGSVDRWSLAEIPEAPQNGPATISVRLTSDGTPDYSVEAW